MFVAHIMENPWYFPNSFAGLVVCLLGASAISNCCMWCSNLRLLHVAMACGAAISGYGVWCMKYVDQQLYANPTATAQKQDLSDSAKH